MGSESLIKMRLSLWRDYAPGKALVLRGTSDDARLLGPGTSTGLQQEIYSWQISEDAFAGVSDGGDRLTLMKALVEQFSPSLAPEERGIATLRKFLDLADAVLAKGGAEWTVSQDAPAEDQDSPYRVNSLLAVKRQLEWLMSCFAKQPGISLSIR